MGNELSNGSPRDLDCMKKYQGMSPGQVKLIKSKFELMSDEDLTIDRVAFVQLMKLKENEPDKVFSYFDLSNDGRIDSHEFVSALSLIAQATLKEKAEIIFSLYDFDHNNTITKNELVILIKTTLTSLGAMTSKGEFSIQESEQRADQLLAMYKTPKDQTISLKEFQRYPILIRDSIVSTDQSIQKMLFSYGIISTEDLRADFGGADIGDMPDPDSDMEREVSRRNLVYDHKVERKKDGIEHKQGHYDEDGNSQKISSYQQYLEGRSGNNSRSWIDQVKNGAPSNWKPNKGDSNPPAAWLDLDYVYGFRCFDCRNNIKFTSNGELVYPTAAMAITLDTQKNQQKFFIEHTDDITCIDVHDNLIVTGQVGNDPLICVWQIGQVSKAVFRGDLKYGISNISFSNDGRKIVAIGMDPEHCIAVYDVDKAMSGRGSGRRDDYLISSGKGPRSDVFDVKFDKADKSIILACNNEVYFVTYDTIMIKLVKGLWDAKTCPLSTVLCIGHIEANIITGTFKGQLIVWRGNRAIQQIEAHHGAVLAMHTKKNEPGLITGGKDGMIIVWDQQMKQKSKIFLQELNLKILNQRICALTENNDGTVMIVGTRGSDMIEITVQNKNRFVMRGHSEGFLRGLAVHPKLQQFYTIGEDNVLACWSIKERKMMSCVKLDYPSRAVSISPDSRFLAVGSINGTILIIDPKTLIPTFNFKDRNAEVSCMKFSRETELLAVGYAQPICEILIYSIKNHFKKSNVLKGSQSTILSIDFSMDCRFIQVNDSSCQVLYYEIGGESLKKVQPDGAAKNKDEKWATYTAIYGWQVQGVWPEVTSGQDINAVDRSSKGDLMVTADDYSTLKLFRFPAPNIGQGYQRYSGHSAHVSNVRFTADDEYIISLGGKDKSIIQWRFQFDKDAQTEQDEAEGSIPDAVIAPEYLRVSLIDASEEETKHEGQMKQYLGPVRATVPSHFKPDPRRDDQLPRGHLSLDHVFGVKSTSHDQEALNSIMYLHNGKIVYPAGSVAVIMDPKVDKMNQRTQSFFRMHRGDINCMTMHPRGNLVASGERAFGMRMDLVPIYIWDAESKQVISHIVDFHLRCINAMKFTPDGAYLVSAGGDEDNSITVHDWSTNQLLCTAKSGRSTISGILLQSQSQIVICGLKSVKFYTMNGRNLKCQPGSMGGQFKSMTCITTAFPQNLVVTGTVDGCLILWKENQAQKPVKAHDGKVTSLIYSKQYLYSAGLDGKVQIWSLDEGSLSSSGIIFDSLKQLGVDSRPSGSGIISMDIYDRTMIIGTKCAEIYEINLDQEAKSSLVMQGHYGGELWGLACSPKELKFVTCGGDSVLRVWSIPSKSMVMESEKFENEIRAVDWSSNGQMIVVGDVKGIIYLYDAVSLSLQDKKNSKFTQQKSRNNMTWIEDIKFSPDCRRVAFGAHASTSHLEVWDIESHKLSKSILINLSLQGPLIHLDWATDSVHIVVNSLNYELKFVNVTKAKDVPGPSVKDLDWHTWTSVLGFPVQGIYNTKEEYDVVSTCASHDKQNLATGEFNGQISLYQYPVVSLAPQQHREYIGHASPVTKVRFTFDDSYLISIGQLDRCIFVWQTDFNQTQEPEESKYVDDDTNDLGLLQIKVKRIGDEKYGKTIQKRVSNDQEFGVEDGDQSTPTQPYLAIKEPSNYYKDPLNQNKVPLVDLVLEYVHGYRSKDCRNNLKYLKSGMIVYNAAALGVLMDPVANVQKFYDKHDDDVLCIDIHPDGIRVATAQSGSKAGIHIWDSNTQQTLCSFQGSLTKGVICLAFNLSGDKLAAVGLDDTHQIVVFDITAKSRTGGVLLHQDRIGPQIVTDIKWKSDKEFTTFGINHLKIWTLSVGGLRCSQGVMGKTGSNKYLCGAFNQDECLMGAADGSLQIYKGHTEINMIQCHEMGKALEAIHVTKDFVLTGGRDSKINILDTKGAYKVLHAFKLTDLCRGALYPEIKSIHLSPDNRSILVGTAGSEIYELTTKDAKITSNSKFLQIKSLLRGHYSPTNRSLSEVWGLAVNPNDQDQYYTCSDDGTLRAWSISQRKVINMTKTNQDVQGQETKVNENGELPDSVRGRSIGVSPDGVYVVVGFKDGTLRVYDKELKQKIVMKCAKDWISDLKFSQDSQSLALGSHDNTIYVYSFPDMKPRNRPLKKHASYITHLDFSNDGNYLHSTCGGYEMLFWDLNQGKLYPTGANALRDEKWYTWTSSLGWPVQGIQPQLADGSHINSVDRSHSTMSGSDQPPDNYHMVATGDDMSNIKVFRYPCVKKGSQFILGRGHSSYITNVRFSNDDSFLLSAGGEDNCIMQWKITKKGH